MKYLRWLILASGIIPLFAWEGKVFQVSGKKVTIASLQTSGVRAGTRLYILKDGKEVGQGRVGNVFHTKVEMTLVSGVAEKGLAVTDKKPASGISPPPKTDPAATVASLYEAATNGDTNAVKKYLKAGVDPNATHTRETTPLMMAAFGGHVETIKVLLKAKADPKKVNRDRTSALINAAWQGKLEVVKILVPVSELNHRDLTGHTALSGAKLMKREETVKYLRSIGAKE